MDDLKELDFAVANVLGADTKHDKHTGKCRAQFPHQSTHPIFTPSTEWSQGGPLIEEYGIAIAKYEHKEGVYCGHYWVASWTGDYDSSHYRNSIEGPTPLIAAMRALVESKNG